MIGAPEQTEGARQSSTDTALDVKADDEYDVALARLLAEAVRRPPVLERIGRTLRAAARAIYERKREEAEILAPEYWYLCC